jgi:DNA-directed RNA polymerase specialized sigma24 family protein
MARIDWIESRLLNWARWWAITKTGGGNYAHAGYTERVDGQGWDAETVIPTNDAEAEETHQAVATLEPERRVAVEMAYLGTGSVAERARRRGISMATLYARVDQAHWVLARWFNDQEQARRAELLRVEALQRAMATREFYPLEETATFRAR